MKPSAGIANLLRLFLLDVIYEEMLTNYALKDNGVKIRMVEDSAVAKGLVIMLK
jgi:hypothetical protein